MGFWEKREAVEFLEFANRKYPIGTPGRWIYIVYLLAINTAARAGEIWGLKPSEINRNGELLSIKAQFNRDLQDFSSTKGRKFRTVPCNRELYDELKAWIRFKGIKDNETVFQNNCGNPISHNNFVKRKFNKDVREWGGKRIRFHDLRHTSTTLMIASGVDLKTAQEICGHEEIGTTMKYVHLLAGKIRETARTFAITPTLNPG